MQKTDQAIEGVEPYGGHCWLVDHVLHDIVWKRNGVHQEHCEDEHQLPAQERVDFVDDVTQDHVQPAHLFYGNLWHF